MDLLNNSEIRTRIDDRNEKAGKKIRDAELMKIPYMLVVGEKEEQTGMISIRKHGIGDLGPKKVESFIEDIKKEMEVSLRNE